MKNYRQGYFSASAVYKSRFLLWFVAPHFYWTVGIRQCRGCFSVSFPTSPPAAVNIQLGLSEQRSVGQPGNAPRIDYTCTCNWTVDDTSPVSLHVLWHLTWSALFYMWFSVSEVTHNFQRGKVCVCDVCPILCTAACLWALLVNITFSDAADGTSSWQASSAAP